jgi:GNAT superfamily N-acetyltransferase
MVADSDEGVVGFALYYIRFSTWKGRYLYLEDLLVTEAWRRKSVGRLLFESIISEAKQIDVNGISWQVLEWNEPAIKFYDRYQPVYDREWINCNIHFSIKLA